MIIFVGDDDSPTSVDCYTSRSVELSRSTTVGTEAAHKRTVLLEDLNAVVGAVSDDEVAFAVTGYAPRPAEVILGIAVVTDHLDGAGETGLAGSAASGAHYRWVDTQRNRTAAWCQH